MKNRVRCSRWPKCGFNGRRAGEECCCYDEYAMACRPWAPGPGCPAGVGWPCPRCHAAVDVFDGYTWVRIR